ncbi:MAG: hypothetical protein M3170_00350 [Candidatus Dormibacteraeota bacterium]|nr:hypothetical protein [Candidatus Dormibacteraeota bacterium]
MIDGRNVGAVLKPGFMVAPVFDLTGCQLRRSASASAVAGGPAVSAAAEDGVQLTYHAQTG